MQKVKVKVNKQELRLQIPCEDGLIVINEIHPQLKQEILGILTSALQEGKDFDEKKIFMDIVNKCTNVEFDGDIFEEQYVTHEVQMLVNEIFIMIQELIQEAYQILRMVLQEAKNEIAQKELLKEKDELVEMAENEEKQNIEVRRDVRKPRPRRSMH